MRIAAKAAPTDPVNRVGAALAAMNLSVIPGSTQRKRKAAWTPAGDYEHNRLEPNARSNGSSRMGLLFGRFESPSDPPEGRRRGGRLGRR